MFRKLAIAGALALALLVSACALNPFASAPVVSAPAPVAARPKPQINTVVVRVPTDPAPAPAAAPSIAYPTLPTQAAPPQVTVNPAPVNVPPAQVIVEAAKPAASIHIPWGDWTLNLFDVLWTALGGTALVMARKALAKAPVIVQAGVAMSGGVDAIVQQMHDLAVNSIEGASKGKALDLNVGSKVLASVVQMGIDKGPDFLASVGGIQGLKEKFLTFAHLAEDVSAAKLGVSVPAVAAVEAATPPVPANDAAPVAPVPAVA